MRCLKGGTVSLPAYFESASGAPATGQTLSNVLFDINYLDGTSPDVDNVASRELGDGWYAHDFTDTENADFIYIAKDDTATYKNFPGGLVEISDAESVEGTHAHADGTGFQEVFSETITTPTRIESVFLNLTTLTQNTTIDITVEVGGGASKTFVRLAWTTADLDGYWIPGFTVTNDIALSMVSGTGEGDVRNIPYEYTKVVL